MKESNILADNVAKNFPYRVVLKDIQEHIMNEYYILANNVAKNVLTRDILQNTEEQFMKESNILADNVGKNLPVMHGISFRTQKSSS